MKFLQSHRQGLLKLLEENAFDPTEFSFVKRKGRILTIHNETQDSFSYLRVEETLIDPDKRQWVDKTSFKIKISRNKEYVVNSWEEVIIEMNGWLKGLKKKSP